MSYFDDNEQRIVYGPQPGDRRHVPEPTKAPERREIWCCCCSKKVQARLTDGKEIYPHRADLFSLPFWRCDTCRNYVGCHHKTKNRTQPLGNIPTAAIRAARQHIHRVLDPIWQSGRFSRRQVYQMISNRIGREFHTSHIRSVEEARAVYKIVKEIAG